MTADECIVLMTAMAACWPSYKLPQESAVLAFNGEILAEILSDLTFDESKMAVAKIAATKKDKFAPTVGEIRDVAFEMRGNSKGTAALEAWGAVKTAIRRFGYYGECEALESLDPLTRKTAQLLGWHYLCKSEDEMADRAHFMKSYDALRENANEERLTPPNIKAFEEKQRLEALPERLGINVMSTQKPLSEPE